MSACCTRLYATTLLALGLLVPAWSEEGPIEPTETIELFNGTDLSNWYPYLKGREKGEDPAGIVTVEDGLLHIAGDERGCLSTEKSYANYRMVVEFKWGTTGYGDRVGKALDCGFQIHATGAEGGFRGLWKYALAAQMIEGGTGDILVLGDETDAYQASVKAAPEQQNGCWLYDPKGTPQTINFGRINWWGRDPDWKDEQGYRGAKDLEKPVGEWNTFEVLADGDTLTLSLNGEVVNAVYDVKPRAGQIQIQIEGGETWFRRIALDPLNK